MEACFKSESASHISTDKNFDILASCFWTLNALTVRVLQTSCLEISGSCVLFKLGFCGINRIIKSMLGDSYLRFVYRVFCIKWIN